ncbi:MULTISPECIES: outer membrane channel protein TolC [Vibrio]|uniref:Outer membrane channel protein TolC n=1 Tax=Vibrio casei TaxID=673372 RepID=A0A368LQ37_9VIBR|nr:MULTISPECIES: outer membrane channel protein TolC [Vibrio]RCS73921.1 outer membrane channel protein TolC [Vibrio casei]SJN31909.1 Type I secretion outer membrane protein, TolC precursor [Vibrio casei]HBV77152.1 outer membrane channel protein TolC [Vibrio sp.]
MKKLLPLLISLSLGGTHLAHADDLAEIYNQAKENDPLLLSSKADRDAAFEAINSSRGVLLPQINLTAGYNITRNIDSHDSHRPSAYTDENNNFTAGLDFSQQLYQRDSWVNLDIAEQNARQQDSSYASQQQSLILRVSQAYFGVLQAQDNLSFVSAEKKAVGRQLEQTKQRFDVGLSAITDVHDAQAQYDSVLADEILAQNDLTNSYEELREITGQDNKDLRILDTKRFSASTPQTTQNSLVDEAQTKNLDLLTARIAQDIAKSNISLANSGYTPSLTLDAGYQYSDVDAHNDHSSLNNYKSNDYNVGINLVVPLYQGGSTSADVKTAQYQYVSASQQLEATYRGVVKNVRAYYNNINASIGTIRAYQQSVVSAKSALEATEAGYEVGTRTIVDVLDSTRSLYDANRNLSDARYNYILSVLQLKQAVGTLSEQDILDINTGLVAAK